MAEAMDKGRMTFATETARENFERALRYAYEARERDFASAGELQVFVEELAGMLHGGSAEKGSIFRSREDSSHIPSDRIAETFRWFNEQLWDRLHVPHSDPWEGACFVEFQVDVAGLFFVDACNMAARVLSAYLLMRKDLHLPEYRDRKEHEDAVDQLPYSRRDPLAYQGFWHYYRTLLPKAYPAPGIVVYAERDAERQVIFLVGKMDATNAIEVGAHIEELRGLHPERKLVLNLVGLRYISSMGLRIFLRLSKKTKGVSLVDVSPNVYDVFEETGFMRILSAEKALRRLSVEGCEKLSEGANGEIYRINADTMVKAYRENFSLSEIQKELSAAKEVFLLGIPTAISYDIVRIGDRLGAVYEMLRATTLAELISKHPERIEVYARQFAGLLKTIHSVSAEDSGTTENAGIRCRDEAMGRLQVIRSQLPKDCGDKIEAMLEALPQDNHLVHGDCHAKNIMADRDGELYLIDMDSLGRGQPVFEFAALYTTYKAYTHETLHPDMKRNWMVTGMSRETADRLWKLLLRFYYEGAESDGQQVEDRARLLAFVRVMSHFVKKGNSEKAERCRPEIIAAAAKVERLA